jgi:hypothetical protein
MLQHCPMKHNSFLRPLKKKGFKEERVTTIGLYDIGKSHDPGIQQEPLWDALRGVLAADPNNLALLRKAK